MWQAQAETNAWGYGMLYNSSKAVEFSVLNKVLNRAGKWVSRLACLFLWRYRQHSEHSLILKPYRMLSIKCCHYIFHRNLTKATSLHYLTRIFVEKWNWSCTRDKVRRGRTDNHLLTPFHHVLNRKTMCFVTLTKDHRKQQHVYIGLLRFKAKTSRQSVKCVDAKL